VIPHGPPGDGSTLLTTHCTYRHAEEEGGRRLTRIPDTSIGRLPRRVGAPHAGEDIHLIGVTLGLARPPVNGRTRRYDVHTGKRYLEP
jgi:hypothetical protein